MFNKLLKPMQNKVLFFRQGEDLKRVFRHAVQAQQSRAPDMSITGAHGIRLVKGAIGIYICSAGEPSDTASGFANGSMIRVIGSEGEQHVCFANAFTPKDFDTPYRASMLLGSEFQPVFLKLDHDDIIDFVLNRQGNLVIEVRPNNIFAMSAQSDLPNPGVEKCTIHIQSLFNNGKIIVLWHQDDKKVKIFDGRYLDEIMKHQPNAIILNNYPLEDAVAIYMNAKGWT